MLKQAIKNYTIVLASSSPRRQEFFKNLDIDFEIRLKETEELYPDDLTGVEITTFLAELKANAFEGTLKKNEILITSDTIVWHKNKAIGKPKDYDDAYKILKSLSNATHEIITAVCFKTTEKRTSFHEISKVTFTTLSDEEIYYYLDNYKPYDKSGAYSIQEWIGLIGIHKIEGSYTNIVGLPVQKVYKKLISFVTNK